MRRIIIAFLIFGLAITLMGNDFISEPADSYFVDVKVGKTYLFDEFLQIDASESLMVYSKDNKTQEILDLNTSSVLITYVEAGRIDVYSPSKALIYSMPGDGSMILGTKSGVDGVISIGGTRYRGYVNLIKGSGLYNVINHISVEKYLYGVLPKEFPTLAPIESIKAQAVTARGFTYSNINKHIAEGFNICDTVHCQVYAGFDGENPNSNRAIDETKGMVVTHNGAIAETVYHSNSGGHTASSENVWRSPKPYLVGVVDPFSLNSNGSTWSFTMTKSEISQRLIAHGTDVGMVKDMEVLATFPSGRVSNIRITGTSNQVEITGAILRSVLGTTQLKSTLFSVDNGIIKQDQNINIIGSDTSKTILPSENLNIISNSGNSAIENKNIAVLSAAGITKLNTEIQVELDSITFNGKGYGHGVGMSQYGAIEMAKLGYTYDQILKFYYTGVDVTIINR